MAALFIQNVFLKNSMYLAHQVQRVVACKVAQGLGANSFSSQHSFHSSSKLFSETYYTETHEWVKVDKDIGTIGITDFAQEQLGDIAFCDLPEVGTKFEKGECFSTIESVKAASDLYMPISAEIVEKNTTLEDTPSLINESPFEKGWIVKVKFGNSTDIKNLLDKKAYETVKSNSEDN